MQHCPYCLGPTQPPYVYCRRCRAAVTQGAEAIRARHPARLYWWDSQTSRPLPHTQKETA
jgi:hypothetical protein